MSRQEIISLESRNNDNIFDIHFYKEGSFWKAYEWSAYLSHMFPSGLKENERLKPLKIRSKITSFEYVQVGLQFPSFNKYFPNVIDNNELFEIYGDNHIVIHCKSFFGDEDFLNYDEILNKWKIGIKANEPKKHKEKKGDESMRDIINEIISFPIENKSFIDCVQFLIYIREKIKNKDNLL